METTAKQRVAELVNRWINRAGLRKEAAAARAGLTYQMLYRAYLDPGRPLSRNPDRAIELVRAFVDRLTEGERCRADEALTVLDLTGTPLSRFAEIAVLFPQAEWQEAFSAYLETQGTQVHGTAPQRFALQLRVAVPEGVQIETERLGGGRVIHMEPRQPPKRHHIDLPSRTQPAPVDDPQPDEDVIVTIRMVV
jgi:hypothetical protein